MLRKSISPIVATALLLVVAVVAVVGFQGWFQQYSSGIFTEVEQQQNIGNFQIADLTGSTLYVSNRGDGNVSVSSVRVGDNDCSISENVSSGVQGIDIGSCAENQSGTVEVVITTSGGVLSKSLYLEGGSSGSGGGGGGSFDLVAACPENYTAIPGGFDVDGDSNNEDGFCLMKYEAKDVGGVATSQPSGTPWVSINQTEARAECNALGANYFLVTNKQWMQVAKLAANNSQNWDNGTVGSGGMFRGHSDNDPGNALVASSNDDNGYYNTNNVAPSIERRTLHIEDGVLGNDPDVADSYNGTVWDLGGNVWEWNNDRLDCTGGMPCAEMPDPEAGYQELTDLTDAGTYLGTFELLRPNSQWNSSDNLGRVYTDSTANPIHAFQRGGAWDLGVYGGAFALILYYAPSDLGTYLGFRCSYVP